MRLPLCYELFLGLLLLEDVYVRATPGYITDLPIYSALAPCAQFAVSYEVQQLSESECQPAVTALQSCACTQDQNSAAVSSKISNEVLVTCGKTASDDLSSASVVFSAYCNLNAAVTTAPPGPNAVSQYITDLSAYSDLAPCASGGLSYLIMGMTNSICPTGGPAALASCVCSKNQNSLAASEGLNTQIKNTCGSTHAEDVTSVQNVLAGYCGLANRTTSFPTLSNLPGSVSYYITALPQYQSLASCAQEALSYPVQAQTESDCPSNPQALVSCVCVKDSNSAAMTSRISQSASAFCGSTASANMASALAVFDYYCSVGKGLAKVTGQIQSVVTTPYPSKTGSQATATGRNSFGGTTATASSGDGLLPTTITGPSPSGSSKGVPVAAIGGAVGGGVLFICFMLFVGWRYRRQNLKNKPPPTIVEPGSNDGRPDWSKAELGNTETTTMSPKTSLLKKKPVPGATSPVSPIDSSPGQRPLEIAGSPRTLPAQLPSGPNAQELHHDMPQYEVPGSTHHPVEMSANLSGPFEMDAHRY